MKTLCTIIINGIQDIDLYGTVYSQRNETCYIKIYLHDFRFVVSTPLWSLTIFYAMETYIMHFLEPAQFLKAPDLAGRKVNLLYTPQFTLRPAKVSCVS